MDPLMFLAPLLVGGADKVPEADDVVAGWTAFAVFIGLCVAVALLAMSLTRHLRKARDNAEHGMFDPSEGTGERTAPGRGRAHPGPGASTT